MNLRSIAACLVALALSGCAANSRMPFPDEVEAWGYDLPALARY